MTDNGQHDVNFFKVNTPHARANRNLILSLAIAWALAVFGFQFLLIWFNEETPEKAYTTFTEVWPTIIENNGPEIGTQQAFARSLLYTLGKNSTVKTKHQTVLKKTLSWQVYSLLPDSLKYTMTENMSEEVYAAAAKSLGLTADGFDKLLINLLPYTLVKVESLQFPPEAIKTLPDIMELYLVHNESIFSRFTFMGFPFHYWYTAQFLLILFVLLCLIYAVLIGRINTKYKFVEEV